MLRLVGIDRMLVDECQVLFCNSITGQIAEGLKALTRSVEPVGWVKMPVRQYNVTPGTGNHDLHAHMVFIKNNILWYWKNFGSFNFSFFAIHLNAGQW
jgi:hypothetical protein